MLTPNIQNNKYTPSPLPEIAAPWDGRLLEEAAQFIHEDAGALHLIFLAFTARIGLWDGDIPAARKWLEHSAVTGDIEHYHIYQHFTTVRAYAVLGELEQAKDLAGRLRQTGRPQDAAEAGVLLSAILWAEGHKDEAQAMMEAVLTQPYASTDLIAAEGAAVLQVLKKISGKTEHASYRGALDPVYVNSVYIAAYAVSKQRKGIMAGYEAKPVKLSKQQKMIIQLLAQGYKRDGIVKKTGLSLSTVKSYTNIAYGKLGAGSAADAVMKARELGMIE